MTTIRSFLLGIGIGAEYPCGSVSASEQTEEEGIAKNAQHRWLALATSTHLPAPTLTLDLNDVTDTMIDFGFVIGAFVPLVLYWMWVASCTAVRTGPHFFFIALGTITSGLYGVSLLV